MSSDSEHEFDEGEDAAALKGSSAGKWSDDDSKDDNHHEVSLQAIKQKTIGRDIKSIYDNHNDVMDSPNTAEVNRQAKKMIMDVTTFTDGKTAADHLRQDLTCAVCHDRLYMPVSLLCGHSFCRACLVWWLNELGVQTDVNADSDGEDNLEDDENSNTGTCPTCRHVIPPRQKGSPLFRVNNALKACLDTLYGAEMNQRRVAELEQKRKATKGESSGIHEKGNEEIVSLIEEGEADVRNRTEMNDETNGWVYLRSNYEKIPIRRNIVMDDCDQRYQLSLGMTKCVYSCTAWSKVIDLELCLIAMEEDEAETGFPIMITEGHDDEALICAGNDRVHTCIQSSALFIPSLEETEKKDFLGTSSNEQDKLKEVTLSRGMISRDGNVRFRIDVKKVLDNAIKDQAQQLDMVKLRFSHLDTGAVLELRLPTQDTKSADTIDCNIDFGSDDTTMAVKSDSSRFLLDNDNDEEDQGPNEYEDDGFVVDDSNEESGDDEEEFDECEICHNGGDLLVCDGGDFEGGCGKAYHLECINREAVPPGELFISILCFVTVAFVNHLLFLCR